LPVKFFLAAGIAIGLIVAGFFLVGAHHEIADRLRRRRRGGYLIGGDSR
jgi:hypothetical protein